MEFMPQQIRAVLRAQVESTSGIFGDFDVMADQRTGSVVVEVLELCPSQTLGTFVFKSKPCHF